DVAEVMGMRLATKTKLTYAARMRTFVAHLSSAEPHMIIDGRLKFEAFELKAFQKYVTRLQNKKKQSFSNLSVLVPPTTTATPRPRPRPRHLAAFLSSQSFPPIRI